ncbi:MAG: 3-dehydroquinate synthase [Solirubrobacterales bacterium]|nr:3-dehydroquinate synthase [Solirubrobacterales bacterium]
MICLVGFMGAGKSSALVELAAHGLKTVDADRLIEAEAGCPISVYFERQGEGAFRELEQRTILAALNTTGIDVVALGGGAVATPAIADALKDRQHTVVWLDVELDTAWRRVRAGKRPLAQSQNDFKALYDFRQPLYDAVADAVLPAVARRVWDRALGSVRALAALPAGTRMIWAASANGEYPVFVGNGLLDSQLFAGAGDVMPGKGDSYVFTDDVVGPLYANQLGSVKASVSIPPGESAKTISQAEKSLRGMAVLGVTRQDRMLALGGGVVGDLAGFCAHTYQRGIPVVQVPTTLVAQVDSAYGGKTGVDLPEGKNYVGAFHLPSAVIADVDTLATLSEAELTAGMAEVMKTALLAGGDLWKQVLELQPGQIVTRGDLIYACARYKCRIVAADERDTGIRAVLNLGHTVGHAIESATGYKRYRHGEAVALGLLAALRLSDAPKLRESVRNWNELHGLPVQLDPNIDIDQVIDVIQFDKKKTSRGVGFVLLSRPGEPVIDRLVPDDRVRYAVEELIQ